MEITKAYQEFRRSGKTGTWVTPATTPHGSPATVTVFYVPCRP